MMANIRPKQSMILGETFEQSQEQSLESKISKISEENEHTSKDR